MTHYTYAMHSTKPLSIKSTLLYHTTLALSIFFALSPQADAVTKLEHTFTPYVGTSQSYDSNILRASGETERNAQGRPVPAGGKAVLDTFIHQIRAGLDVDWKYSLQELIIKAEVNQNWYSSLHELDYLGHDVLAQWNWAIASKLKGNIGYRHIESLASFAQLSGDSISNNVLTDQRYFGHAEYQILPSIYLNGGFIRNEWLYGAGREFSNQTQNNGEIGIKYKNLSRTMLGFRVVLTDAQYQRPANDPFDNAFFRTTYNLDWEWKHSSKLRFGGSVGYLQQEYEHNKNLNFSDVIARVDVNWQHSEKTALAFSVWQQVNQAFTQNATFVLSQRASLIPAWLPTPKIRVEMPLSYETQNYLGDPQLSSTISPKRKDEIINIGLNIIYTPWINTEFSLEFQHENRDVKGSDLQQALSNSYDAQTVGLHAKVEF